MSFLFSQIANPASYFKLSQISVFALFNFCSSSFITLRSYVINPFTSISTSVVCVQIEHITTGIMITSTGRIH